MMRKFFVSVLAMALIVTNGLLVGCAPGAPVVEEAKDLEVELDSVPSIFDGQESICFTPVWTINNPNNFPVTIEVFDYSVYGEGLLLGKAALRNVYIPADTEIMVEGVFVVRLVDDLVLIPIVAAGLDEAEAWAQDSQVPEIIALFDKIKGMINQLVGLSNALGGASMTAEAAAAGEDGEAPAKLRAISDKLSATLNSEKMAGMLGPGAGDKLTAAADHAEAGMTAALKEDVEILNGLKGKLDATVFKLKQAAATAVSMPRWKTLGGGLASSLYKLLAPNDLKDAWDTMPVKEATFESEGKISFASPAGKKEMTFAGLAWTAR